MPEFVHIGPGHVRVIHDAWCALAPMIREALDRGVVPSHVLTSGRCRT